MRFEIAVDNDDHDLLLEIEGLSESFSRAVAAYVEYQPSLKAAYEQSITAEDKKIFTAITNMQADMPNPYEADSAAARTLTELQHSILNAQKNDRHITMTARFLRPETLAGLMPEAALKRPAVYIHVMEKYGLRQTAAVLNYKFGVKLG